MRTPFCNSRFPANRREVFVGVDVGRQPFAPWHSFGACDKKGSSKGAEIRRKETAFHQKTVDGKRKMWYNSLDYGVVSAFAIGRPKQRSKDKVTEKSKTPLQAAKEAEKKLGYTFLDPSLLINALTHSSYANEQGKKSNERLEFLGDSVLSLVVSDHIYRNLSHLPEGDLTKLRASLVCEKSLCTFAKKIGLGECLLLGRGEANSGGSERPSLLADAFEAVLAALYLDGGMAAAKEFVLPFVKDAIANHRTAFVDYKTRLQEIVQQNKEDQVIYVPDGEEGPDHAKTFFVELRINSNPMARGAGKSKKEAEQDAARQLLILMGLQV